MENAWKASCPAPSMFVLFAVNWKDQGIVTTFWFKRGFYIVSVVVEQCFLVCFVMIGVGLRTDQGTIESHTDCFGPQSRAFDYIITICQIER